MGNHANTITSLNGSETNGYNASLNLIERKVLSDFLWYKTSFNHLLIKLLEKTQFTEF